MTSDVRDHLTEIPPLRWVIAAFQCYKLFDRGRLAVALHYTEFQAVFFCPSRNFNDVTCVIPVPRTDAPAREWVKSAVASLPMRSYLLVAVHSTRVTSISCRRWTRATRCLSLIMLRCAYKSSDLASARSTASCWLASSRTNNFD